MNARLQTQAKATPAPTPSLAPAQTRLLRHRRASADLVTQPPLIQAKLTINRPNDRYEQEADRVADQVMRMPEPYTQKGAAVSQQSRDIHIQRACTECDEELRRQPLEEEEEEEILQAKEVSGHTPQVTPDLAGQINSLRGGGQPLPESARTFFEPRFGYDFSRVRIHADSRAGESAQAVNARAYTVGRDIVFGPGQYAPGTTAGRRLLAHELTHIVQQTHGNTFVQRVIHAYRRPDRHQQSSSAELYLFGHRRTFARRQQIVSTQGQHTNASVLQRIVNYLEQATESECGPLLEAFSGSVATIDRQIRGVTGPEASELRDALERLRSLRAANRVTCWYTSGGIHWASYDNASGELRLHMYFGGQAAAPDTLIHEAIHAVHAARYPRLSRLYAEVLAAGGTRDQSIGILLLQWKAWTEYWAYRRQAEYLNLLAAPEFRRDPHLFALGKPLVQRSISRVRGQRGQEDFDPSVWHPPPEYRASGRRAESSQ